MTHMHRALTSRVLAAGLLALVTGCGGGGSPDDDGGSTGSFTIAGSVNGLTAAGLVLHNNGGDALGVPAGAVTFAFPARVARGAAYAVSVSVQPGSNPQDSQDCTVTQGSGSVDGDVNHIVVTCGPMAALALAAAEPADAASAVPRNARPVLTFSAPIQPASVADGALSLASNAGLQTVEASVDGPRVTLAPATRLLPLAEYEIRAGTAVSGTRGQRLASPIVQRFTTADGTWRAPQTVARLDNLASTDVPFAIDRSGNALAVWSVDLPSIDGLPNDVIHASRYDASTGLWSAAAPIAAAPGERGQVFGLQLALDAEGNGLMAWQLRALSSQGASAFSVWVSRFSRANGQWEAPRRLSVTAFEYWPVAAVRPDGSVAVLWARGESSRESLWLSTSSTAAGAAWSVPQRVDDPDQPASWVSTHALALAPTGERMVAAWGSRLAQSDSMAVVRARVMDGLPDGQPRASIVSTNDGHYESSVQAVIGQDGEAHVAWLKLASREHGAPATLWRAHHGVQGWGAPQRVSLAADDVTLFQLATNNAGHGVSATWLMWVRKAHAQLPREVRAIKLSPASDAVVGMLAHGPGIEARPHIARLVIDAQGNATATWMQNAHRFVPDPFGLYTARLCACNDTWIKRTAPLATDMAMLALNGFIGGGLVGNAVGDAMAAWVAVEVDPQTMTSHRVLRTRRFD
jgi:hypothetical protein